MNIRLTFLTDEGVWKICTKNNWWNIFWKPLRFWKELDNGIRIQTTYKFETADAAYTHLKRVGINVEPPNYIIEVVN